MRATSSSGNTSNGLDLRDGSHHNTIAGNLIGSDVTGGLAVPNGGAGVMIGYGAHSSTVGGTATGSGNIIVGSGSGSAGLVLSSDNVVQGNWIGTNPTLAFGLGNSWGVYVNGDDNLIGGMDAVLRT